MNILLSANLQIVQKVNIKLAKRQPVYTSIVIALAFCISAVSQSH